MPSKEEILNQSKNAYGQWAPQWREHCKRHKKFEMKSLNNFQGSGVGKAILCVANGYSLEKNIDTIKENQHKVDILACDKTLGHLINHGIKPTYMMLADANVSYEKYMKPYEDQLQDTILFSNVCANPEWTHNGNWKDICFYVNKDIINSEIEFSQLSGCGNIICAGTNVSNAQIILLTQSDEKGKRNFFGYDKMILIGFDYSWTSEKYYAFDHTGDGKDNYMRHIYLINNSGQYCFSSENLLFSSRWLADYIRIYELPVVQCSGNSILNLGKIHDLNDQMNYEYNVHDKNTVQSIIKEITEFKEALIRRQKVLKEIGYSHREAYLASI